MAPENTLADLLMAVSYAAYKVSMHYRSHQIRGSFPRDCVTCRELDEDQDRADAALTAYWVGEEAA